MSLVDLLETGNVDTFSKARRNMEICNACRYCEGYCAVFPAMERRRLFSSGDLMHLSNLCHNCQGCYHACQYAPPHEYGINIPEVFSTIRVETYKQYAWPNQLSIMFNKGGLIASIAVAVSIGLIIFLCLYFIQNDTFFGIHLNEGAFYKIVPYNIMVLVPSAISIFAILSISISTKRFWNDVNQSNIKIKFSYIKTAVFDVITLKHLSGGGHGCNDISDKFTQWRRFHHQFTMYGFMLCFASTSVATIYDHFLNLQAPYAYLSIPVLLGTIGGILLSIGSTGLLIIKWKSDPKPQAIKTLGLDYGFLFLLKGVAETGLLLLIFRETSAMGVLLAIHLGFVLALFLLLPYSKFVHGIYRFIALIINASETQKDHLTN